MLVLFVTVLDSKAKNNSGKVYPWPGPEIPSSSSYSKSLFQLDGEPVCRVDDGKPQGLRASQVSRLRVATGYNPSRISHRPQRIATHRTTSLGCKPPKRCLHLRVPHSVPWQTSKLFEDRDRMDRQIQSDIALYR